MSYSYLILAIAINWYAIFLYRMLFILKFKYKIKGGFDKIKNFPLETFPLVFVFLFFTILALLILGFSILISFCIAIYFCFISKEKDIVYLDLEKYAIYPRYFMPSIKWNKGKNLAKFSDIFLVVGTFVLLIIFIIFDLLIK